MSTYQPTWESLRTHRVPSWFSDAKFGIWAHWGPQCVAESGDWYARHLYGPHPSNAEWEVRRPRRQHAHHLANYGPPSEFGYKDLLPLWGAERFDAEGLMDLYVASGARYFLSLAVHCDNFALWDSAEQPWNAARIGPRRDIVADWERAARNSGLPFGLSFHNNWTWRWLDTAHGTDADTGLPHDGRLTKADGAGLWWDGLDPHDLYLRPRDPGTPPDAAWVARFWRMVREATDRFQPDAVYFDDLRLPFDAGSELPAEPPDRDGLRFLADYYARTPSGGVVTIKRVPEQDRTAVVLDSERRQLDTIQEHPWQFDTSDGEWFRCVSDEDLFHPRKTERQVLHTLVDVVSKNGTLLLNIPQSADGTIDEHSRRLLEEVGAWLRTCGEGIYGTRPWRVYGEGPTALAAVEGYNEADLEYTAADIRYTASGSTVYATLLDWPENGEAVLRSFGREDGPVAGVTLLGWGPVDSRLEPDGLHVRLPASAPTRHAHMLRIDRVR
jgi:alpha-L-fucosidase